MQPGALPLFACDHCGFWQRFFEPPTTCPLCLDPSRTLPRDGWRFHEEVRAGTLYPCRWAEVEPGLWRFWNEGADTPRPEATLIRTSAGNLMFEGCTHFSPAALDAIATFGGVAVVAASHPAAYGALWQVQDRFGAEAALSIADRAFWGALRVTWPYEETLTPLPGLTLHPLPGVSAGHAVLHDKGRKMLFAGGALSFETAADDPHRATGIAAPLMEERGVPQTARGLHRLRKGLAPLAFKRVWTPWQRIDNAGRREVLALVDHLAAGRPHAAAVPLADLVAKA